VSCLIHDDNINENPKFFEAIVHTPNNLLPLDGCGSISVHYEILKIVFNRTMLNNSIRRSLTILPFLFTTSVCSAATVISDDFENGANSGWHRNANTVLLPGGPVGSSQYLNFLPGADDVTTGLGDQIGGADNFVIDFYFRVQSTTSRQFSLGVSTTDLDPNPERSTINIRLQGESFAVFNGGTQSWIDASGLGSVSSGSWYRMQVEGVNWGTAGGSYTLRLSDAGGDAFTSSVANLTTVQHGAITGPFDSGGNTLAGTAQSFLFSTAYGANPGFDLDNVVVTANVVPEPSAAVLSGVAAVLLFGRRRKF
jgi:hypothetical protein